MSQEYPIGVAGEPWGDTEKNQWLSKQSIQRSYQQEVVEPLSSVSSLFVRHQYGELPYDPERYPLFGFTNKDLNNTKPTVLITGGVHGYETSGVQGAVRFLLSHASAFLEHFNFIIAPCISPWGYETINRWNPNTIDPNRSFRASSTAPEPRQVMDFVHSIETEIVAHFDLHETTDSDETEFRPALAAKIGTEFSDWGIPDGFYTVADSNRIELEFQQAVIESVRQVTHIAPADHNNQIIGCDVISEGVICYDKRSLHLCGGFTDARFVTTTEVYPDSSRATPEQCIQAQVSAIIGGLNYLRMTL